ncbi:MAG: nucleoside triphosphate pyrophosphohydrolase family protein [Bacteroidota bacterium]|nr:nucleoside triphosphate pyrophosphohydrolase family protein [Bacteroidota bacterium]
MVEEFYKAFGQEQFIGVGKLSPERAELRENLYQEELREYLAAKAKNDRVEILDAVVDMWYIHIGTLLEIHRTASKVATFIYFGDDEKTEILLERVRDNDFKEIFIPAFEEVHRSNMSKLDENGKPIFREDGKIIKGPNYFRPNLKQFFKEA